MPTDCVAPLVADSLTPSGSLGVADTGQTWIDSGEGVPAYYEAHLGFDSGGYEMPLQRHAAGAGIQPDRVAALVGDSPVGTYKLAGYGAMVIYHHAPVRFRPPLGDYDFSFDFNYTGPPDTSKVLGTYTAFGQVWLDTSDSVSTYAVNGYPRNGIGGVAHVLSTVSKTHDVSPYQASNAFGGGGTPLYWNRDPLIIGADGFPPDTTNGQSGSTSYTFHFVKRGGLLTYSINGVMSSYALVGTDYYYLRIDAGTSQTPQLLVYDPGVPAAFFGDPAYVPPSFRYVGGPADSAWYGWQIANICLSPFPRGDAGGGGSGPPLPPPTGPYSAVEFDAGRGYQHLGRLAGTQTQHATTLEAVFSGGLGVDLVTKLRTDKRDGTLVLLGKTTTGTAPTTVTKFSVWQSADGGQTSTKVSEVVANSALIERDSAAGLLLWFYEDTNADSSLNHLVFLRTSLGNRDAGGLLIFGDPVAVQYNGAQMQATLQDSAQDDRSGSKVVLVCSLGVLESKDKGLTFSLQVSA